MGNANLLRVILSAQIQSLLCHARAAKFTCMLQLATITIIDHDSIQQHDRPIIFRHVIPQIVDVAAHDPASTPLYAQHKHDNTSI